MIVTNLKYYRDISFDDYLKLPGYSYSFLKSGGKAINETDKMRFGTEVHKYLLTPSELSTITPKVKQAAMAIKEVVPPTLFKNAIPELSITADFTHEGLTMPYKGRVDFPVFSPFAVVSSSGIPGLCRMVIDFKVSDLKAQKAIEFFRYDRQTSGYAIALSAPVAILISGNPKGGKPQVEKLPISSYWWEEQVIKYGKPAVAAQEQTTNL